MATGDIKVIKDPFGTRSFAVDDRTTSTTTETLKPGEPVGRSTDFATVMITGTPAIGTDIFFGIVAEESEETSTADGTVSVTLVGPGTILRGQATTSGNIDTAAELLALRNNSVLFDGPAAVSTATRTYTIDEDDTDDPNVNGLFLLDGDIVAGTLDCSVNVLVTIFGSYL